MEATFNQSWGRQSLPLPLLLNDLVDGGSRGRRRGGRGRGPKGQRRGGLRLAMSVDGPMEPEARGERRGRGRHGTHHHLHDGGPHGPRGGRGRRGGGPGRARRGDVRLAALLLIAEEPRNGYQIIQELESRTDGRWKPSPGAIYPALNQLEDEGLIRPSEAQSGKAFEITDAGREQASAVEKAPWEREEGASSPTRDLGKSYGQAWTAIQAVADTGDDALIAKAEEEIRALRKRLYQLLAEH